MKKQFAAALITLSFLLPALPAFARSVSLPVAFKPEPIKTQTGVASWYGSGFIGGKTANGEIYRRNDMTAAHKTLPFNTWVRVTDQRTGRSTVVRINNRGPFVQGRVIDLSFAAAKEIGLTGRGLTKVKLDVLQPIAADETAPENAAGKNRVRLDTWSAPLVAAGLKS